MVKKLLVALSLLINVASLLGAPEIILPNGPIRGKEATTIKNTHYYAFEKIPYATPPVGQLRFKAPIPPANWDEPLDTTNMDVECYQQQFNKESESEDCLYLNVFTPQLPDDKNDPIPVMVYIHGGGFVGGSGRHTYGDRIVDQNLVFVAINYRLGPFGFLSTQDEVIPGNNGLKDQHLALKWVHDNINLFGGDPDKITIFGQSAGAASCAYQLLNQQNEGLFRAAILQSGTFLSPWSFQRRAREIAFDTAAFINDTFKTNRDSQTLFEFLQSVDAKALDRASEQYHDTEENPNDTEILHGFFWTPVVEVKNPDAFLTKKMYGLLQAGNVIRVPTLLGITSEENLAFNTDAATLKNVMGIYDENLGWLVPHDMAVTDETNRTNIGSKIREIYTGGEPLAEHLGDGVRYSSDTSFTRSVIKHAEIYSALADTFFYQFSYDGEIPGFDVHYDGAESVAHSEDYAYIFCGGTDCDVSKYPQSDQTTVDRIISIWTNFAKYQNPTPEPSELLQNITWPLVSTENGDFLYVDINENLEIRNHPKEATYQKWVELYDSLGYSDFDTY
ncbi:Esterase-6-like Protein [Tribolium castaneum]|uniref:Carboxylic ester hydrolase n=1 Tax=Tribolium castaneum TaxID=7070 RepID=D6WFU3_TRICA|nr:PREDICTED: venom carboxylesterase-6 [Tribolium castaneum]EFA00511.1 Esterase-6-like Protein [Tribolium castaneum]|eukprot:XP_968881.2 PREDICTED: venom carboxylesterase-6 [Tribolium castaneum]